MPKRAGTFHRDAQLTMSASPVDPYIKSFILRDSLQSGTPLDKMQDRMALYIGMAIDSIRRDVGLNGSPRPASAVPATIAPMTVHGGPRHNKRGKVITEKRSAGALAAWDTRRQIKSYIETHPGISRADAKAAVLSQQPQRTLVRTERGEKGWDTRTKNEIAAAAERGETITWDEGRQRAVQKMRDRRTVRDAHAAAEKTEKKAA